MNIVITRTEKKPENRTEVSTTDYQTNTERFLDAFAEVEDNFKEISNYGDDLETATKFDFIDAHGRDCTAEIVEAVTE